MFHDQELSEANKKKSSPRERGCYYNTTFSNIFEKLMSEQEKVLVNKGLTGDYNSTIAKLILTKHGYSDKQDIDLGEKTFEHIRKQRDKYSK